MVKTPPSKGPFVHEVLLQRDRAPSFDQYPFHLPPIRSLTRLMLHPKVTFFIGENGSGKSTLLEAIAVAAGLNAEGGTRNFNFSTRASHSDLSEYLTLVRGVHRPDDSFFLRAESFFNVATAVEGYGASGYSGVPLHEQSHGESFMALLVHRFRANGLYVLDEPEAALSPQRQLALLGRMHQLLAQGCQFLIATHSPILMAYPNAAILEFSAAGIQAVEYRDTEHYWITKTFLDNPDRMLAPLMSPQTETIQGRATKPSTKSRRAQGPFIHAVVLNRDRVASFDAYPYSLPPIHSLTRLKLHPQVTFLIGENGAGKSTMLEAIAVAAGFNPEGGGRNFDFSTRASHSSLGDCLTLIKGAARPSDSYFLRAESFFTVATEIERLDEDEEGVPPPPPIIDSYGGVSLHEQSHGESFMALLIHRFGGGGLYLMDEPEAALSPQRQLAMLGRMHQLLQQGSQFIIATHSPILMAYPNAAIHQFSAEGIQTSEYKETDHYRITKMFLDDPERMLALLMSA